MSIANPIDWLYAACLDYFIFFSIDSSEARKQYDEYCLSIMQTITYAQKLNIYILYWYFQQSQCLNFRKNIQYTTYIDKHGAPMLVGSRAKLCPACPCVKTALNTHLSYIPPMLMLKINRPRWTQYDDNTLDPLILVMVR